MKKIYVISIVSFVALCIIGVGLFLLLYNKSKSSDEEEFYYITVINDGLILVKEGDQYKYLDESGKVVIEDDFMTADNFINKKAIVSQLIGDEVKYTLINTNGENAINNQYFSYLSYDEDTSLYIYRNLNMYGLMDIEGNLITEPIYTLIDPFNDGISKISIDNQSFGFIDKDGHLITDTFYSNTWGFVNEMAVVIKNSKFGAINKKGELVIPLEYIYIGNFNEKGFAVVEAYETETPKKKIIDKSGNITYTHSDLKIEASGNYFLINSSSDGYLLIDERGKSIFDEKIQNLYYYFNNYILVYSKNDQLYMGVLDSNLQLIFEVKSEDYLSLPFDMANNKMSLVSRVDNGIKIDNGIKSFIYECDPDKVYIGEMSYNGHYVIRANNLYGVIDSRGKVVIDITHRNIKLTTDGYAIVKDGKTGVFNMKQVIVIPQQYDIIMTYNTYK